MRDLELLLLRGGARQVDRVASVLPVCVCEVVVWCVRAFVRAWATREGGRESRWLPHNLDTTAAAVDRDIIGLSCCLDNH
jgi:hypothetical protein